MELIREPIEKLEIIDATFDFLGSGMKVDGVSVDLPMNNIVHITGDRGVGKSFFLKVLAGLIPLNKGAYLINNQDIKGNSFEELLKFRLNIGYSFEYGGLISNMTLYDNLILPLLYHKLASPEDAKEKVLSHLEHFGLLNSKDQRPSFVSGSMRKELCVLRAFILDPEVLLLDSPTVGFTKENIKKLQVMIKDKFESGRLKHVFIVSDNNSMIKELKTADFHIDWKMSEVAA